jgi:[calcium/calmodulin-dependent protein kinase] kinase
MIPTGAALLNSFQDHTWVTRGATDPLLSAEENCSDPVDPPNPLELNHAFTRRMSHLICVVSSFPATFRPPLTNTPR